MAYKITYVSDLFVDKIYEDALKQLNDFFEINWTKNKPKIIILDDRKSIDLYVGEATPKWLVGGADGNQIFVLARENYTKESSKPYTDEYYKALIIHELVHLYANILTKSNYNPQWVTEGIACYLAGQNNFIKKPNEFVSFLDFFDSGKLDFTVYAESGFAVQFLIENFGKNKFLELLKTFSKINSKTDFDNFFVNIYGFKPSYFHFNKFLNFN